MPFYIHISHPLPTPLNTVLLKALAPLDDLEQQIKKLQHWNAVLPFQLAGADEPTDLMQFIERSYKTSCVKFCPKSYPPTHEGYQKLKQDIQTTGQKKDYVLVDDNG